VIQPGENFMMQMYNENFIKYQIIAFYLDSENPKNSFVKYGSYDPDCFEDPGNVILIDMINSTAWAFNTDRLEVKIGERTIDKSNHKVIIEPAYPFHHAPTGMLTAWQETAQSISAYTNVEFRTNGVTVFDNKCEDVNQRTTT
jgi:hypothetical protein